MQPPEADNNPSQSLARRTCLLSGVLMALWIAGCTASTTPSTSATSQPTPQTYFAPYVVGGTVPHDPLAFTIDDGTGGPGAFSSTTYFPTQVVGPQVLNAGILAVGQRGLRSLEIEATYTYNSVDSKYEPTAPNPLAYNSFAVELAGQAGGLVQLFGQPVEPLVAAAQCPNFTTQQIYQFISIPAPSYNSSAGQQQYAWDPMADTAYGSVSIESMGSAITFQKILQYTLGGNLQASVSPPTGACGPTNYGYTIGVPGPDQFKVTDPGIGSVPPQATVGIGATGLLVEDNGQGAGGVMAGTSPGIYYENVLGAGTGALGLPQPSGDITSALTGAQYLGFIYSAGAEASSASGSIFTSVPWSSNLASFGFSSIPSNCSLDLPPYPAPGTPATLIFGGDFPVNPKTGLVDPGQGNSANLNYPSGNCDFAIELIQGPTDGYGLYSKSKVHVGTGFPTKTSGTSCGPNCFPAVAIAGQLPNSPNGKYALFVIGYDGVQPWAIYLLQSSN